MVLYFKIVCMWWCSNESGSDSLPWCFCDYRMLSSSVAEASKIKNLRKLLTWPYCRPGSLSLCITWNISVSADVLDQRPLAGLQNYVFHFSKQQHKEVRTRWPNRYFRLQFGYNTYLRCELLFGCRESQLLLLLFLFLSLLQALVIQQSWATKKKS